MYFAKIQILIDFFCGSSDIWEHGDIKIFLKVKSKKNSVSLSPPLKNIASRSE